ncbi:MAG: DMT family transporter [Candidatus Marinimicrobia bacterium]|nr:DMT family transporter [Candidatus Neomarinimicrobiota bacterium]
MKHENKVNVILFFALICVSTASIFARWLDPVPAVAIAMWRMLLGSAFLWMYSLFYPQSGMTSKNKLLTMISGMFLGLHFLFFFTAIKMTTIANATFLATLAPLFTILIETLIFRKKIIPGVIFGLFITFVGMVIIIGGKLEFEHDQLMGNLSALTSSFWISITYLITEKVRRTTGTLSYSRSLYLWAAVLLFVTALIFDTSVFSFTSMEFTGLLLIGLIPTVFGHSLLYYSLRFVSPSIVASVPLGEPVIASVLAMMIFNEFPGILVFVGGAVILMGLFKIISSRNN